MPEDGFFICDRNHGRPAVAFSFGYDMTRWIRAVCDFCSHSASDSSGTFNHRELWMICRFSQPHRNQTYLLCRMCPEVVDEKCGASLVFAIGRRFLGRRQSLTGKHRDQIGEPAVNRLAI
jgi:hypothetical protein